MNGMIHQFLLSQQGMHKFRSTLIDRNEYFFHKTTCDNIPGIMSQGLLPCDPGDIRFSRFLESGIVIPDRRIACFSPSSSEIFVSGNYKPGREIFTIAIRSADLPSRIGADYSYDPIFEAMSSEFESMKDEDISDEVMVNLAVRYAHRYGSIVSYDIVDPSVLLVAPGYARPGDHSTLNFQPILQL